MTKYSFLLLLLVIFSCTDENMTFNIGNDKLDINTNIRFTDTLTVRSYTVMMDSIRTSGLSTQSVVVGRYDDPEFGTISANSYFRVVLPGRDLNNSTTSYYDIPNDAVFDSLQLFLAYNEYYTGDTTLPFAIHVHRLKSTLKPNEDGYFYNNDSIAAYPESFGYASFKPKPLSSDTVWIDLNPDFGNELFELLMESADKVKDNEFFLSYFKGLMLTYDAGNKAIIGFQFPSISETAKIQPVMRLYYHYFEYTKISKYYDFTIQGNDYGLQFNQFTLQHPALVDFPTAQYLKLDAYNTENHCSYAMAGVGIVTRIEIPYLKNLLELYDNIKILDASLELQPLKNTYKTFTLPSGLSLYTTDNRNRYGQAISDKYGKAQEADLKIDMLYQEETWYSFDITGFLGSQLEEETDNIPAMLLTVSADDLYRTLGRVVLGSQLNAENKVKLKIYYMNYE
jgi:hypothetical protein